MKRETGVATSGRSSYQLYYGSDKPAEADGTFVIPTQPVAQQRALLVIATDGRDMVVEYYPHVSIIGSDAIQYDPTKLTEIPIKCTILQGDSTHDYPGRITPKMPVPPAGPVPKPPSGVTASFS